MKSTLIIAILFVLIYLTIAGKYDTDKLQVGIKYRPENCEPKAKDGDKLSVHYTGKLKDGTEFDSSIPRKQPFTFTLGAGHVIQGWDLGLLGACKGEKRKLVIPYQLGYGEMGSPPKIPPKATLIFDVEVVGINEGKDEL